EWGPASGESLLRLGALLGQGDVHAEHGDQRAVATDGGAGRSVGARDTEEPADLSVRRIGGRLGGPGGPVPRLRQGQEAAATREGEAHRGAIAGCGARDAVVVRCECARGRGEAPRRSMRSLTRAYSAL